jgi:hypothetical protein
MQPLTRGGGSAATRSMQAAPRASCSHGRGHGSSIRRRGGYGDAVRWTGGHISALLWKGVRGGALGGGEPGRRALVDGRASLARSKQEAGAGRGSTFRWNRKATVVHSDESEGRRWRMVGRSGRPRWRKGARRFGSLLGHVVCGYGGSSRVLEDKVGRVERRVASNLGGFLNSLFRNLLREVSK